MSKFLPIAVIIIVSLCGFAQTRSVISGNVHVAVEDRLDGRVRYHYLIRQAGQDIEVHFAQSPELQSGQSITVSGEMSPDGSTITNATLESGTTSTTTTLNAAGNFPSLALICNFTNSASSVTPTSLMTVMQSTSKFDKENSFGKAWLTPTVAGPFTLSETLAQATISNVQTLCNQAAEKAGFVLSNYVRFVYVVPSLPNTGWWGYSFIGGQSSWIQAKYGVDAHVIGHEMGHNFGLYHSHSLSCGTKVVCTSGTVSEYGDPFDTMGKPAYQSPDFNAFQKERLGWLNASGQPPILTVTTSGYYVITPLEVQNLTAKAIKVLANGSTGQYYYIELRQALGFDSYLSGNTNLMTGLLFHLAIPSSANSSDLLDMTPGDNNFGNAALDVNKTYVKVTLVSVSVTGATIKMTF